MNIYVAEVRFDGVENQSNRDQIIYQLTQILFFDAVEQSCGVGKIFPNKFLVVDEWWSEQVDWWAVKIAVGWWDEQLACGRASRGTWGFLSPLGLPQRAEISPKRSGSC